ncbi:hypothetical protein CCHL11_02240 [Colletotrichum chlorophyti]|uniref:Uncharacterized protein n=1 Tax=Colletotrichum chlorophyti TaxID=708187 RepID=A0A1Q8S6V0_9PEZI|nr:hypothetical protein CCHL11_02240 [Colletotrichum chlorophyti]
MPRHQPADRSDRLPFFADQCPGLLELSMRDPS